ncbi:class I SAM-dependent methyltransferase [Halobacterium zhouii]|uniref:class I SAM-dependent methyltransferase n=1 Tax=Halobacterium zhouii TaxID=2902624 RepID=UPI001E2FAF14|nr:class I SAM-dependent methyltransferase [Halobacterium zhouii]
MTRRDVRRTYDRIAEHFAQTREYAWPEVEEFLDDWAHSTRSPSAGGDAAVALDVGCGNGRHSEVLAAHADRVLALDASRGLLGTARDRATDHGFDADLLQGDASRLPLCDGVVDVAVYVATLHHLPSRESRVASLDELARVLAKGATALVSAWSTEHDRFESEAHSASDSRTAEGCETESEGFDTTVDWTLPGGDTVDRFYHIYAPDEFRADLQTSSLAVREVFVSSGNCYAVVASE